MTPHLLIIGYGNPLREDDGVGPRVAETLRNSLSDLHPTVISVQQLNPELSEECAQSGLAVFIDAGSQGVPGDTEFRWIDDAPERSSALNHFLDARQILSMAKKCYGHAPVAVLITITGASFGYSTELSATLATALPVILKKIEELVRSWTPTTRQPLPCQLRLIATALK
jgi:hydrogenase maturation protease